jgi:hypothetical protein
MAPHRKNKNKKFYLTNKKMATDFLVNFVGKGWHEFSRIGLASDEKFHALGNKIT